MNGNIERGIIRSIYLKNFVTYDEVIVRPGRNLNLIIGANGTGKSTLVSAIVLGLGGKPSVLDKGNLASFVKSELNQAIIKIELEDKPGYPVTITRTISKDNKSSWMINDKSSSAHQVEDLMKEMHIQVDNLCQFLPQEKVQSFSTMTATQLLEETERSVGDSHLLEYHLKLKKIREQQSKVETNLTSITKCRENFQQKYNGIKDTVGQIQERKRVQNRIQAMKQKRAWVLYGEKMDAFKASKNALSLIQNKKERIELEMKPGEDQIERIKRKLKNCENTIKSHDGMKARTKINNTVNMIANCEQKMNDLDIAKEVRIKDEQERGGKIHNLTQQRNKLVNDLQQMVQDYGSIQELKKKAGEETPELNQYRYEMTELKQRVAKKKQDSMEIDMEIKSHETQRANIQNIHDQRLYLLQQRNPPAYQAVQWLRRNKDQFAGRVFEPMLLYINVPKDYAKYFENHINFRDLVAFVCEEKKDMNRLITYASQQKLKINVLHSDPSWPAQIAPKIPLRDIERFGFKCYMASLLDAPDTIKKYLLRNYRLQDIPIGSDEVADHLDNLPRTITKFFTRNNSYSVNYSRYTGQKSTRQSQVYSHDTLTITLDSNKLAKIESRLQELQHLKTSLNQEIEVFNAQYSELDQKIQVLRKVKQEIQHHIQQIQGVEIKLARANSQLKDLEERRTGIDQIEREHKEQMRGIVLEQMKIYKQYNVLFNECFNDIMNSEEMKLRKTLLKNQLETKQNELRELQDNLNSAKMELDDVKREYGNLKAEANRLFKEAKALTGDIDSSDKKFEPYQRAFEKLPATAPELFEEIQRTQGRLYCLGQNAEQDRNIMEEFEQLKRDIEKLDKEIAERDQKHAELSGEIKTYYDKWYSTITALTERINDNFSKYFATIKCAGQVELISGDNKMDFDKYGLQIKVKFRDSDELQILTRTHQSGGERALTTAIYMISLQELSIVPFRCMDEINQGMDPTNERRVFELIVSITSNRASSQYFLLTPKLLPGLQYEDSVTVLTIFSGKYNVPSTSFDITNNFEDILGAARAIASTVAT